MAMNRRMLVALLAVFSLPAPAPAEPLTPARLRELRQSAAAAEKLFARDNLIAWCIVPFDAKRRGPEERAVMLKSLGFQRFAYDWRAEHIPSFDEEIQSLRRHGIELAAWWFPPALDDDARAILAALKRNEISTQLWVTLDDPAPAGSQEEKVAAAVKTLLPIAKAAEAQACIVGLYNHGGWFGEPENQLAVIAALDMPNVGVVYNLHHGHAHLDRFDDVLRTLKHILLAINLNGMDPAGDERGRKILPIGRGERDLEVLRAIRDSGYRGPVGILGHTQDDAEARLADNLDGLDWLVRQLDGAAPGELPTLRTPLVAKE